VLVFRLNADLQQSTPVSTDLNTNEISV